jgi:tRNA threonylcarbamoyladenosine biosynthesis protein TsaB
MLIALDTSTRWTGIALYDGERGLIAERNWLAGNRHTAELLPECEALLKMVDLSRSALTAVAVAIGPGSFTGLRVALSAGKGLALARSIPLVGVPTLAATAYPFLSEHLPVLAIAEAGRGRACWASFRQGDDLFDRRFSLSSLGEMLAQLDEPTLLAGELTPELRAACADLPLARPLLPARAPRRAGYVAELGWLRLASGLQDDLESLAPIYLQEPAGPKVG